MFLAKEISTSALLDEWSTVNSAINDHCNMSNGLIHLFFLFVILFTLNLRESGNTTYNTCNITELMTYHCNPACCYSLGLCSRWKHHLYSNEVMILLEKLQSKKLLYRRLKKKIKSRLRRVSNPCLGATNNWSSKPHIGSKTNTIYCLKRNLYHLSPIVSRWQCGRGGLIQQHGGLIFTKGFITFYHILIPIFCECIYLF